MAQKAVAVITLHNSPNYGSCLQAYATQRVMEKLGAKSEIIDFYRHDAIPENETERALNGQLARKLPVFRIPGVKALARIPVSKMVERRSAPLNDFRQSALNLTARKYYSAEDLEAEPPVCDVYCTGSDQVWNSKWNGGFERAFYLSFAPEGARRIAYASSIGKSSLENWEIPLMRKALSRYSAISVREAEAVDLLDSIGVRGAVSVVDPTLMLNPAEWKTVSDDWTPERPYILLYQLNRNPDFDVYAQRVSKSTGLPVMRIAYGVHEKRRNETAVICPTVGRFLSLFFGSELVLTDSFHGAAFSVNLGKPFVSIAPERFSGRIGNLLAMTGLEGRLLSDWNDVTPASEELDFSEARVVLARERGRAWSFLRDALDLSMQAGTVATSERSE